MKTLKLTSWNIKHLERLIQPNLSENLLRRKEGIKDEILRIDADILCLIEGPNSEAEIDLFVQEVMNDQYTAIKSSTGNYGLRGTQWIWFLVKNKWKDFCSLLPVETWFEFTRGASWPVHYWGNFDSQLHRHYRTPQVLIMEIGNQKMEFIGVHFKSKYVNGGRSNWNAGGERRKKFIAGALKARVKLATEAIDVRRYINRKFQQLEKPAIFVLGDMNDGPGKEYFEDQMLFFDLVSSIQGDIFSASKFLNHALFDYPDELRWSAEFDDFITNENNKKVLIDHILFTQPLVNWNLDISVEPNAGLIEHEVHDVVNSLLKYNQKTSDHKPISLWISMRENGVAA